MTWADERVVFRDVWADAILLLIDGVDLTTHRGVPMTDYSYQLQEPYEFGPATFRFPGVSDIELRSDPSELAADLTWLRHRANAQIVPVLGGVRQRALWRGFINDPHPDGSGGVEVGCAGEASGRLAYGIRTPRMFRSQQDIGYHIAREFRRLGIPFSPQNGPVTGIRVDSRGSGEDSLTYINGLLADAQTLAGVVWTIRRNEADTAYEMVHKDLTTPHVTVFYGTDGVGPLQASNDMGEQPNTILGNGVSPVDGHQILNAVIPGIVTDTAPVYPIAGGDPFGEGTVNADTVDGAGITRMHAKLIQTGLMDLEDASPIYDDETTDAVEELQRRGGRTVNGIMDEGTWDDLFDVTVTGTSVSGAEILPLAQDPTVRKYDRTASGNLKRKNPLFDKTSVLVERWVSFGLLRKRAMVRWSRKEIARLAGKNWVGSLPLNGADVFQGDYAHGDASPVLLSKQQIRPGWNILVKGFDGDTLFHIAGINVSSDGNVNLAVDTQARDLRNVGEIIARDRESKRNRNREYRQQLRSSGQVHDSMAGWCEQSGKIGQDVPVRAGHWTTFQMFGGQEGTCARIRTIVKTLEGDGVAYFLAVFGAETSGRWLDRHMSDPGGKDADGNYNWATNAEVRKLQNKRVLLYAAGTDEEPCGYGDHRHTNDAGGTTGASPTGVHDDPAGFSFRCFDQNSMWVAVYVLGSDDAVVQSGRIMWNQNQDAA